MQKTCRRTCYNVSCYNIRKEYTKNGAKRKGKGDGKEPRTKVNANQKIKIRFEKLILQTTAYSSKFRATCNSDRMQIINCRKKTIN